MATTVLYVRLFPSFGNNVCEGSINQVKHTHYKPTVDSQSASIVSTI